jgi:hypothetical protein
VVISLAKTIWEGLQFNSAVVKLIDAILNGLDDEAPRASAPLLISRQLGESNKSIAQAHGHSVKRMLRQF